ncbi:MAG: nodulation protein NfeD, partial [Burkholderiaceae bacterium]
PVVWLLQIDGPISPASADYFISNLKDAERAGAALFVLELDTPGGLDRAMRDMVKAILASSVPVATYVAPSGSRAASAGTYLMYASHVAAMAPATNIGSSTPVSIGGESPFPMPGANRPKPSDTSPVRSESGKPGAAASQATGSSAGEASDKDKSATAPPTGSTMERKVVNDAVAYIRSLAQLRGRNPQWAEKSVREAANLSASDALAGGVIDLIATDLDNLLRQLNGRKLQIDGKPVTLALGNATVHRVTPGWRYEVLSLITDPNIAYILLMIGIYGLILEVFHPGTGVPGVVGVICLLLAAYALQMLPISYVGLALILIGTGLMLAETFAPGFGVFGIGGAIAFVIGSVMLMQTDLPAYQISLPIIAAFAAASVAVFVFVIGAAMKSRTRKVVSGRESMLGDHAQVIADFLDHGLVRLHGEIWQAHSKVPLTKGATVRVVGMVDLVLNVEPKEQS